MTETAILGGGCFWCTEAAYTELKGVTAVQSGYAGGEVPNPTYKAVCTGRTGHAEVVEVKFDPAVISYEDILRVFFTIHDPTTLNRQGGDVGTQYRSVIFYADAAQKAVAERYIAQLNAAKIFHGPIVTRLDPATGFFKAEAYHQDYLVRHPDASYIATFDLPKVAALKALFPGEYRAAPVTAL